LEIEASEIRNFGPYDCGSPDTLQVDASLSMQEVLRRPGREEGFEADFLSQVGHSFIVNLCNGRKERLGIGEIAAVNGGDELIGHDRRPGDPPVAGGGGEGREDQEPAEGKAGAHGEALFQLSHFVTSNCKRVFGRFAARHNTDANFWPVTGNYDSANAI
jgi:hypothetical protein